MIGEVKKFYKNGTITLLSTAESLIKLVQDGKLDEFDKKFAKFSAKVEAEKDEKKKEEDADNKSFKIIEKSTKLFNKNIKERRSEQPTFELMFKDEYSDLNAAWARGVAALIRLAENGFKSAKI